MRSAILGLALLAIASASPAGAQTCPQPDASYSFFVPQTGSTAAPFEGTTATRLFRTCPNMDGSVSFPNNARIKIVLHDAADLPLAGVPADEIYILFNGGTAAQGFSGIGADSIIANRTWNPDCPDVRMLRADVPTDASGVTYITFLGSDGITPGVSLRDPTRKWGHFDSDIPVFVGKAPCTPIRLQGKVTSGSAPGSYTLRLRNLDVAGGLAAVVGQGERMNVLDLNAITACIGGYHTMNNICYWCDFDGSGAVNSTDLNLITTHLGHSCTFPNNP